MTPELSKKDQILSNIQELQESLLEDLEAEEKIDEAKRAKDKSSLRVKNAKDFLKIY